MKTLITSLNFLMFYIKTATLAIAGVLTTQCVTFIINTFNILEVRALDNLPIMTLPEWREILLNTWSRSLDITSYIVIAVVIYMVVLFIIHHFDGTRKSVMVVHTAIATSEEKL